MRSLAKKYDVCTVEKIEANIEYMSDIFTNTINTLCGDWTEGNNFILEVIKKNLLKLYSLLKRF